MKEQTREEPRIMAAAERRMQNWALAQQMAERTQRLDRAAKHTHGFGEFITISREAGAGGGEVAQLVGRKLRWEVLDKNLLDRVSAESRLARPLLDAVDETTVYWANGILGTWLDPKTVPHDRYMLHLRRVVMGAARRGNVVFVGRGVHFLLPPGKGLAVRIIAPHDYRVEQTMRRHGFRAAKARRYIASLERGRREFVHRFFDREIDDPHLYDLMINVAHFGPDATADEIINAYPR